MNQLFVRLAASGVFALGLGATALADSNASIGMTGANSTNTITNRSTNSWMSTNLNRAEIGNWNNQNAKSGNVWVTRNTNVGGGVASGWAGNDNNTDNQVSFDNNGTGPVWLGPSGGDSAVITNTGANSDNRINQSTNNRFSQTNVNDVTATNNNDQSARSGNVDVAYNTNVGGPVTSGNVSNQNATTNSFDITNQTPDVSFASSNPNMFQISDTGYGSNNRINSSTNNSFRSLNDNQVTIANDNQQTARSGNVSVIGNTNVNGPVSSGNVSNTNSTQNTVNINN